MSIQMKTRPSGSTSSKTSAATQPKTAGSTPSKPSGNTHSKTAGRPRTRRRREKNVSSAPVPKGKIVEAILRIAEYNRATRSIDERIDHPLHVCVRDVLAQLFGFVPTLRKDYATAHYGSPVFDREAVGGERAYRTASVAVHNAMKRLEDRGLIRRYPGRGGACLIDPDEE